MPNTPESVTAAIKAIPGMTKINHLYKHPFSDLVLWWFDCETPGRSVVGFLAEHDTFLILMDGPGHQSKAFVDPNEVEGMMFVAFPDESIPSASMELADLIAANFPEIGGGTA